MGTTERKKSEIQRRELHLLDVARKMLIAQGYAGLSLERLAEATEYSKGTVYLHFKTKEDLVTALASQTMEQRAALFERVTRFEGRPRERMQGIGVADELFARLYPQSFRSELIIKMADLQDRASPDHRDSLRAQEARCIGMALVLIEEAVAAGDLPPTVAVPQVMIAVMTMAIGTHTVVANFGPLLPRSMFPTRSPHCGRISRSSWTASAGSPSRPSGTMPRRTAGSQGRSSPMNANPPVSADPAPARLFLRRNRRGVEIRRWVSSAWW